jgi:hypothetical protein
MFGFSLSKILLIVAVIAAVWFTLKYVTNKVEGASGDKPEKLRRKAKAQAQPQAAESDGRAVEDMVRCRVCGAYQTRSAGPCGRADCPAR